MFVSRHVDIGPDTMLRAPLLVVCTISLSPALHNFFERNTASA
jgi:hypothetical protein